VGAALGERKGRTRSRAAKHRLVLERGAKKVTASVNDPAAARSLALRSVPIESGATMRGASSRAILHVRDALRGHRVRA